MLLHEVLVSGTAALLCGLYTMSANADPVAETLFYTTLAGPANNVGRAVVTLDGSTLTVTSNNPLASVNGAAGIVIAPDGNLLIGGQSAGFGGGATPANVHEITQTGRFIGDGTVAPGNGAYSLALGPGTNSGTVLRALCNSLTGSCGATYTRFLPLDSPITDQVGTSVAVIGPADANLNVTDLAFDTANDTWYYGATPDGSTEGQFGRITFGEGAGELTIIPGLYPAENVIYDPFSNTIIMDSGSTVAQFDPTDNAVVSSITITGELFEQAAVDGNGHLFVVSKTGDLLGIDYDRAVGHSINGPGATHAVSFLAPDLGGVAALPTAITTTPEPASLALIGTALFGFALVRRCRGRA